MGPETTGLADRIKKLEEQRAELVEQANAQLAPLEAQACEISERKAVIVGNANLAVGRIEGELKVLKEFATPDAKPPEEQL